jgi:hypothetical protein
VPVTIAPTATSSLLESMIAAQQQQFQSATTSVKRARDDDDHDNNVDQSAKRARVDETLPATTPTTTAATAPPGQPTDIEALKAKKRQVDECRALLNAADALCVSEQAVSIVIQSVVRA